MMERTDAAGRWESENGTAWLLVEPSQQWLDQRSADAGSALAVGPDPVVEFHAKVDALTDKLVGKAVISEKDRGDIADAVAVDAAVDRG